MDYDVRIKEIHIATQRLFESVSVDLAQQFRFDDWEMKHLADCKECEHIRDVFGRQFSAMHQDKKTATDEVA
jgi:hypothetical protein